MGQSIPFISLIALSPWGFAEVFCKCLLHMFFSVGGRTYIFEKDTEWALIWLRTFFFFWPYLNHILTFPLISVPGHSNMLRDQLHLQISWNQFSHWINKTKAEAVLGVLMCREEEHLHALLLLQISTLLGWIVWLMKRTPSNPQLWHTHIEQCISHMTTQLCTRQNNSAHDHENHDFIVWRE